MIFRQNYSGPLQLQYKIVTTHDQIKDVVTVLTQLHSVAAL